jgi:hypothetical protein
MTGMTNDKQEGGDRWQWWQWRQKRGQQQDPPGKYTTPSFTCHITLMMPPPPSPVLDDIWQTSAPCPWVIAHHQCHLHPTPHCCGWHSTCPHAYEQLLIGWDCRCSLSTTTGDDTASTSRMMMGCSAGGTTQQWRGMTPTPHLWAPAHRVDCGHLWQWNNKGDDTTTRGHNNTCKWAPWWLKQWYAMCIAVSL